MEIFSIYSLQIGSILINLNWKIRQGRVPTPAFNKLADAEQRLSSP